MVCLADGSLELLDVMEFIHMNISSDNSKLDIETSVSLRSIVVQYQEFLIKGKVCVTMSFVNHVRRPLFPNC
jgi:hypothetical protein